MKLQAISAGNIKFAPGLNIPSAVPNLCQENDTQWATTLKVQFAGSVLLSPLQFPTKEGCRKPSLFEVFPCVDMQL